MKIRSQFLILIFFHILVIPLFSAKRYIPVFKNAVIIQKEKKQELNSIQMHDINYYVIKNEKINIKKVESFYINELSQLGYKSKKTERNKHGNSFIINLSMMNEQKMAKVLIEDKINTKKIYVYVSIMDNIFLNNNNKNMFSIGNKKDNPGFDFNDVPRCFDCIRVFSLKTDSNNNKPLGQVTYQSFSYIKTLEQFYYQGMPKKGWNYIRKMNDKKVVMLYYKKKKKNCQIFIMYNDSLKKNMVMIQVSQ